jgi:hypothetical protein
MMRTRVMARSAASGFLGVLLLCGRIATGWAADGRPRPAPPEPGSAVRPYIVVPFEFAYPPGPGAVPPSAPGVPGSPGTPGTPSSPALPHDPGWDGRFLSPLIRDDSGYRIVPPGRSGAEPGTGGGYRVIPKP